MKKFNNFIINQNNLVHNVKNIKNYIGNKTLLCVMVKANAYGHNVKAVCESLKYDADGLEWQRFAKRKKLEALIKQLRYWWLV